MSFLVLMNSHHMCLVSIQSCFGLLHLYCVWVYLLSTLSLLISFILSFNTDSSLTSFVRSLPTSAPSDLRMWIYHALPPLSLFLRNPFGLCVKVGLLILRVCYHLLFEAFSIALLCVFLFLSSKLSGVFLVIFLSLVALQECSPRYLVFFHTFTTLWLRTLLPQLLSQ